VQVAHGVDGAEVQVLAEDEGAAGLAQHRAPVVHVVGAGVHDPGLDPGVAFPLPALGDEIVFQGVQAAHQGAGIAVGAQAHVHAEDLAVGGEVSQGDDEALAQAVEEVVVVHLAAAVGAAGGLAFFRIDEDVVHVGGDVQLPSAQLAHAHHQQALGPALAVQGFAVLLHQAAVHEVQGEVGGDVGQQGHGFHHLLQGRGGGQVADDEMGHDPLAQAPQHRLQGFLVGRGGLGDPLLQVGGGEGALPGFGQDRHQFAAAGEQLAQVGTVVQGGLPGGGKSRVGGGGGSGVIVGIVIHQGIIRLYPGFPGVAGLKSTPSPRTCHCSDPPNTFAKRRRHRCRRLRPVAGRGP